jgi:DNA-binding CsgD family transcriptional regulator
VRAPTELELQALRMRAQGLSNPEIADELGVKTDTVKRRLWRARMKLDARDTAHTLAQCYRHGFLEVPQ